MANKRELAELFRNLGAPDPEEWAESQIEEGIPQLARFLFLRQAWRLVVAGGDSGWIEEAVVRAKSRPDEPMAGVGHAVEALRQRGATDGELAELVRGMQTQLLFDFCYLLSDPGDLEEEVGEIRWALAQVDDEDRVVAWIDGLHESVLETDPTGNEP